MDREARIKLLEKAREAKKAKAEARRQQMTEAEPKAEPPTPQVNDDMGNAKKELEKAKKTPKAKANKVVTPVKTLEINDMEDLRKAEEEFEVKKEVLRVVAPKKKRVVKRIIEVEETSSEEEVIEEVVKVPKTKTKEIKVNRTEAKAKIADNNKARLMAELFN